MYFFENITKFILPNNIRYSNKELIISNYIVTPGSIDEIKLKPYEARVYLLR